MKQKKGRRLTIGFKMILIISLILMAALTGLSYITTFFFQEDSVKRIQEVTSDKSQAVALTVKSDLSRVMDKARYIAYTTFSREMSLVDDAVSPGSGEQRYRQFLLNNDNTIYYVALVEKRSESVRIDADFHNRELIEQAGLQEADFSRNLASEHEWHRKAFAGIRTLHNVSSRFEYPVLVLSFPLENDRENRILSVCFSMNIFLDAVQSYSEYTTYIVNGSGELIAHQNTSLLINEINLSQNDIVREMFESPLDNGQTTYVDENNVTQIGSFRKVDFADLGVISTVKRATALAAIENMKRRNLYITAIFILISMMIVYLFAKTLTHPVKKLVDASQKIKAGEYRLDIKPASNDEIGDLTESFVEMGVGLEEREKMKDAFGKFVNREIADLAMKGELKLGGERKHATVLFSDIRSFTAISERLEPEEVVEFLNEYMTEMVACVDKTHGVVDKFIGDAVMALWGTPVSHGNDTENAINGALLMRKALIEFNKDRGTPDKPVINIGCGINTGPLVAGQIGSADRMEYTVIGDTVNLASRVESLNKPFGTDILISNDAYTLVKGIFAVKAMKKITVKGKSKPQQIYAVLGRKDDPERPRSLQALRKLLGITPVDLFAVQTDMKEAKYEITEK